MKRQKNSLFLILIILATILVITIFGTPLYSTYQEEARKEDSLLSELKDIEQKLSESKATQVLVENSTQDLTKYYDTTSKSAEEGKPKDKFREDVVLKFLYDTVEKMKVQLTADLNSTRIALQERAWRNHDFIENITFTPWVRNEYGFREWKANVTFVFSDEAELTTYIDLLINSSEYQIFIHELSYPEFGSNSWPTKRVTIPLKIWYQ